jgi:hypothetical protein
MNIGRLLGMYCCLILLTWSLMEYINNSPCQDPLIIHLFLGLPFLFPFSLHLNVSIYQFPPHTQLPFLMVFATIVSLNAASCVSPWIEDPF